MNITQRIESRRQLASTEGFTYFQVSLAKTFQTLNALNLTQVGSIARASIREIIISRRLFIVITVSGEEGRASKTYWFQVSKGSLERNRFLLDYKSKATSQYNITIIAAIYHSMSRLLDEAQLPFRCSNKNARTLMDFLFLIPLESSVLLYKSSRLFSFLFSLCLLFIYFFKRTGEENLH